MVRKNEQSNNTIYDRIKRNITFLLSLIILIGTIFIYKVKIDANEIKIIELQNRINILDKDIRLKIEEINSSLIKINEQTKTSKNQINEIYNFFVTKGMEKN